MPSDIFRPHSVAPGADRRFPANAIIAQVHSYCNTHNRKKENAPPDGRALGAFSSAVCLVGLRFGSDAPRPEGGLILGCRNQHAEPNLIVRAHHTMCGVLRLFRSSTRLLTGRRTKPLILSALLNNPRYLTGDFPQKAL